MSGIWAASYIALWILFIIMAVVLLSVLRNIGVLYESMKVIIEPENNLTKLNPGDHLPEITIQDLNGNQANLSKFCGSVKAISIVSPDCSSCYGYLQKIAESGVTIDPFGKRTQDVIVLSVGNIDKTIDLMQQVGLNQNIPILVDKQARVRSDWGIKTTPTTIVVDDNMKVIRHLFGAKGEAIQPSL